MFTLNNDLSKYTFENFKVTKANRLAHAAALAVTETPPPGGMYNPFFLYGNDDTTLVDMHHLLAAIGNRIEQLQPLKVVLFMLGSDVTHWGEETTAQFLQTLDNVDILLLEDIQDIPVCSNIIKGILEKVSLGGMQLVISSNSPIKELQNVDFATATQIQVGMVVEIKSV